MSSLPKSAVLNRFLFSKSSGRRLGFVIGLLLLANFVLLRIADIAPAQILRHQVFDFYQRVIPSNSQAAPIAIVDIDEASLAELGQWPWPRRTIAALVERLSNAGALAIGFDVIFAERDRLSPANLAVQLPDLDPETMARLSDMPDSDAMLARTLTGKRVVLGQSGNNLGQGIADSPPQKVAIARIGVHPDDLVLGFDYLTRNIGILENAAAGLGAISAPPERDGVTRRLPTIVRLGERLVPTLSLEMLRVATGQTTIGIRADEAGVGSIVIAGLAIPTDPKGLSWVRYDKARAFPYVSAKDVLSEDFAPERVTGRFVFVGTSSTGLLDVKTTPIVAFMPGVEVHAHVLQNVLTQSGLTRPHYSQGAELMMLVLVSLLILILTPRLSAITTLALGAGLVAVLGGLSVFLFVEHGILLDVTLPAIASFTIYALLTALKYVQEERDRKQVRNTFSQYVAPALVEQLAEHPEQLKLGGEMREISILFADIRGFTSLAEHMDATELTTLINRILTPMTDAVLENGGTVDKYIGDCIMAIWNAPLDDPDHAENACCAALDMQARISALNEELRAEWADVPDAPHINIGLGTGINTGLCCVGNIGSTQRFDYSALGDAVNLASRLEGQSRFYGCKIVAGAATAAAAKECALLHADRLRVVGREQPEDIYAVLGGAALAADEKFKRLKAAHDAMFAAYLAGDWATAAARLKEAEDASRGLDLPVDAIYQLYRERLDERQGQPAPEDWDGVYVAVKK